MRKNEDKQEYYLPGNMYPILPGRNQCICKYELKLLKIADHYDALVKYDSTEDICDFNIKEPTVPHENLSSSKKHEEMETCYVDNANDKDRNKVSSEDDDETCSVDNANDNET